MEIPLVKKAGKKIQQSPIKIEYEEGVTIKRDAKLEEISQVNPDKKLAAGKRKKLSAPSTKVDATVATIRSVHEKLEKAYGVVKLNSKPP